MAEKFYKGFNKTQGEPQVKAAQGPNQQQAAENINANLQNASKAIDTLNALANNAWTATDNVMTKKAKIAGEAEANKDKGTGKIESESSAFSWGGIEQQQAYNKVRSESLLLDMPQQMEQGVSELALKDYNKPIDELNFDQQAGLYRKAQDNYIKAKGIEKNPQLFSTVNSIANEIQNKHLPKMYDRSVTLGKAKAKEAIGTSALLAAKTMKDPASVLATFDANDDTYETALGKKANSPEAGKIKEGLSQQATLGNKSEIDQAKLEGLFNAISSDPDQNLDLLVMMKSPEFKERFGYIPEYDKMVTQVDKISSAAQESKKIANAKAEENLFYKTLSSHSFTDEAQIDSFLDTKGYLDDKKKHQLKKEAVSYMKLNNAAFDLGKAYDAKDIGQIRSATKETREALFFQKTGLTATDISFNDKTITNDQALKIKEYVDRVGDVPKVLYEAANGTSFDPEVIKNQVKSMHTFSGHLGIKNIGKIFSSRQQARLTVADNLIKTHGSDFYKHTDALKKFDEDSNNDSNFTVLKQVDKDLKAIGLEGDIEKFAIEGGSNLWEGTSDMQPFFTSRSASPANQEYASKDIKQRAYSYKLAGLPMDLAVTKSMEDFKAQNQWVKVGKTASFIPSEFGADEESIQEYLLTAKSMGRDVSQEDIKNGTAKEYNAMDSIMKSQNLDPKDPYVRAQFFNSKISVAPTYDYNRTKKLEILSDNLPTGEYIDISGYEKFKSNKLNNQRKENEKSIEDYRKGVTPQSTGAKLYEPKTPDEIVKIHNQTAFAVGIADSVKKLFNFIGDKK